MKKNIFRISSILFVSIIVLFFPSDHSDGCSGDSPEPDDYYTIFENSLFDLPLLKPFFLSEKHFFDFDATSTLGPRTDNLKEWVEYFNNNPAIDDIEAVIYPTTFSELDSILLFLNSGDKTYLNKRFTNNTLIAYLKKSNYKEFMEYILYAKECEPLVTVYSPWEELDRDSLLMTALINKGEKRYSLCSSKFLRDRYAYQVIRLAQYIKQYKRTISLYDKYFYNRKDGLIKYWSLAHKAGAIRKSGRLAEANYLFSKIFDACPSKRTICLDSYVVLNDSLREKTLKLCKNKKERVVVSFLEYLKLDEIEGIKKLYELDPKSEYLELILSRLISRFERRILPAKSYYGDYNEYLQNRSNNDDYSIYAFETITQIARKNNTKHPYLWYFAGGYIGTLVDSENPVEAYFIEAKRRCPKDNYSIINRIKITELISRVSRLKKLDYDAELEILAGLVWLSDEKLETLRSQDAYIYIMYLLANKYLAQGDTIKAHLCIGTRNSIDEYNWSQSPFSYDIVGNYYNQPVSEILEALYLMKSPLEKNPFNKFLAGRYSVSEEELLEIEATKLLSKYDFEGAVEKFNLILSHGYMRKPSYFASFSADPFIIHINDCHDCDYRDTTQQTYSKLSFAERMAELLKISKSGKVTPEVYFLLANGFYNMTFYGNCWQMVAYYRDFDSWGAKEHHGLPAGFFDCTKAEEYYLKAMNLSSDKEFKAKCYFMAAKCEQNTFYNVVYPEEEIVYNREKKKYRNHFRTLAEKYSDTKFYQEALNECKYFNEFVSNNY